MKNRHIFKLFVLLVGLVALGALGCEPSGPKEAVDGVKGVDVTFEDPDGHYAITYPSKWGEGPGKAEGTTHRLTEKPQLTTSYAMESSVQKVAQSTMPEAERVGEPELASADGETRFLQRFDGDDGGAAWSWMVQIVNRGDVSVIGIVGAEREEFERSRAGYVKVLKSLEHRGKASDSAGEAELFESFSDELRPAAEKTALAALAASEGGADVAPIPGELEEAIYEDVVVFANAALCDVDWHQHYYTYSRRRFDSQGPSLARHARALMVGAQSVLLQQRKEQESCSESQRAETTSAVVALAKAAGSDAAN